MWLERRFDGGGGECRGCVVIEMRGEGWWEYWFGRGVGWGERVKWGLWICEW